MRRGRITRASAAALTVFACTPLACTHAPAPVAPARPVVAPKPAVAPTPIGRWVVLDPPSSPPRSLRKGALAAGPLGERWFREGSAYGHAATFAGAALVDVVEHAGKLGFVAEDGAVLSADEPLGPFVARRAPPAPLHAVAVGKGAILGIDPRGRVLRSVDAGLSWKDVGLAAPVAVDLALDREGKGRVLVAPTGAFATTDDGATFAPESLPANEAAIDRPSFERSRWSGDRGFEGRLALDDARLYAAIPQGGATHLLTRALDGSDTPKNLATFDGCRDPVVAARDARIVVACTRDDGVALDLLESEDGGKTFAPTLSLARRSMFDPKVWVSAEGSLLVERACPKTEPKCATPILLRPRRGEPAVAVQLEGGRISEVLDVAFTGGSSVIALGSFDTADKKSGNAVFRSNDGGRTFTASQLPALAKQPDPTPVNPALTKKRWVHMIRLGGPSTRGNLALDPQGRLLAVVWEQSERTRVFGTPDDGASFVARPAPAETDVALAGAFGLARSGHDAFVTHDAGASWSKLDEPGPWIEPSTTVCSRAGCLSGNGVVRLGQTGNATPWTQPKPRAPRVASMLACKPASTQALSGYLGSGDRLGLDTPAAPTRYAFAFEHLSADDQRTVSVAIDRGKGLQLESLLPAAPYEDLEFQHLAGSGLVVRGAVAKDHDARFGWITDAGKVGRSKKDLPGAPVGFDGEALLVRHEGELHRVEAKGLGPALAKADDDASYARRGPDLLRLLKGERSVQLAKLAKGAFVDLPTLEVWPTAADEISLGAALGAPMAWVDEPHTAGVLLRLLEKVEARPLPALDALAETVCGPAHAAWPRVLLPLLDGHHVGVKLDLPTGPYWLGVSDALVGVGPAGETCREALRIDAPWESALGWISLSEPRSSAVVRAAAKNRIELHTLDCAPSTDTLPAAAAGYPGY